MSAELCRIPLTRGLVAIVDAKDFDLVSQFKWHAHRARNTWYARTDIQNRGERRRIYMHALLTGKAGVDHADRDGLNNARANLRPCTQSQNSANTAKTACTSSSFKGVTWDRARGQWSASVHHRGRRISLGRTRDEELAAARYDIAARALFGDFAVSNLGVTWSAS